MLAVAAAACAASTRPGIAPEGDTARAGGDSALARLADEALDRGQLDLAEERFRRLLGSDAASTRARVGLGRVALARSRPAEALAHFEAALAVDPDSIDALVGRAEVRGAEGDLAGARDDFSRAVALDPARIEVHQRFASLTGPARETPRSLEDVVRLASEHPYDPLALVRLGETLARAGRPTGAQAVLEKVIWLADLDPDAATRALQLLRGLSPEWSERRVVPVHVYADEPLRARPDWRFQVRTLWLGASNALQPVFDVRFVVMSIGRFRSARLGGELDPMHAALRKLAPHRRESGIVAGLTGRPAPRAKGHWKDGVADFLGRRLTVRVAPGSTSSRVLSHEILHLYGAIHVLEGMESIMNPSGRSLHMDPMNLDIVRALTDRRFDRGGFGRNVLPQIDVSRTIDAYVRALRANLVFRDAGIAEAIEMRRESRYLARAARRRVKRLDEHLGDVSSIVANLMLADDRRVEAVLLFDLASDLYGRRSERGRRMHARAGELREQLR